MRQIDHLVYCVPDLATAVELLSDHWGVEPVLGGRHLTKGTKNALLNLGDGAYLELLALDGENKEVAAPRWMGIDHIERPTLTRWAIKSEKLEEDRAIISSRRPDLGEVFSGSRERTDGQLLEWSMLLPAASPTVEIVPFAVDWLGSEHPTKALPAECSLKELRLFHPDPETIQELFTALSIERSVHFAPEPAIQAYLETPNGLRLI